MTEELYTVFAVACMAVVIVLNSKDNRRK